MIEIGSSDAPVVLGVSPHKTPWQLFAEKVGLLEVKDEPDEIMAWGTALQHDVMAGYARQHGYTIGHEEHRCYHPERPWQRATLDGILLEWLRDGDRTRAIAVEVKCVTGQPPDVPRVDWLIQCLHQRMVLGVERQVLLCFGALRLVAWEIPLHQRAMERVLREEERFLERIATQEPPPVLAADASVLARAWPFVRPEARILPRETLELVRRFEELKLDEAGITKQREQAEAEIKALIGDAAEALWPDGTRYSFKPYTVKEQVRKAYTARPLKRVSGPSEETE